MSVHSVASQVELDKLLLWGDRLRVLISSGHVTYGEINELLREKGIFLQSTERPIIVPLLSSTLLTPSEFSRLVDRSYSREATHKYKTDKLNLRPEGIDWGPVLLEKCNEIVSGIVLDPCHSFKNAPQIISHNDGSFEIKYTVLHRDLSKNWLESNIVFDGGVLIKKQGKELVLELQKTHTSRETERVNDILVRAVANQLKKAGVIANEKPKRISFDDFSNEQRVQFFINLTSDLKSKLKFIQLVDFAIARNEAAGPLPPDFDISLIEGGVRKIDVNGEDLHSLKLFSNSYFKTYCLWVKMRAVYSFNLGASSGEITVIYWFGGKNRQDRDYEGTEFTFSVEKITGIRNVLPKTTKDSLIRMVSELRDAALSKALGADLDN